MLVLLCSPNTLLDQNCTVNKDVVSVLARIKAMGNAVAVLSNHSKPIWFDSAFAGTSVLFFQVQGGRQGGDIIKHILAAFHLNPYDLLVLAGNDEDIQMGKNGGAVLLAAGWSSAPKVKALGIQVDDPAELESILGLLPNWTGSWWYSGDKPRYSVKILSDLSSYGVSFTQEEFSKKVGDTVKNTGGERLKALLALTVRSLLFDNIEKEKDLAFGVYPSSSSNNNDSEILSDFTHRLRTTVSLVRYAKRGEPLFIRHKHTPARHRGGVANRADPISQITSIHLNPVYRGKINNRHVVVVDDCSTYGVSFGVSAALLRRAGARKVTCIAIGKFGKCLNYYEIDITADPFSPITATGYSLVSQTPFGGTTNSTAQRSLQSLIQ